MNNILLLCPIGKSVRDMYHDDDDSSRYEPPQSRLFKPERWKRAHMLWASLLIQVLLIFVLEFSYSSTFGAHVYQFIMVFKFIQSMFGFFLQWNMKELLLVSPLLVCFGVMGALMAMGAETFRDFTFSFFMELSVMMFQRQFFDPLLKFCRKRWPRWRMILRHKLSKRRRMTRDEKAKEEAEWKRVNSIYEHDSEGVEPLLDSYFTYSCEVVGLVLQPLVISLIMIFSKQTLIPFSYSIRGNEMVYYLGFAIVIIPFSFVLDIFILNALQLMYGWRIYDYLAYQKYRFKVREDRWVLRSEALDESIAEAMQTLDLMGFSSQYYFLNALFGIGIFFGILGITVFIRWDFNLFGDPVTPFIILVMFAFGNALQELLKWAANAKVKTFGWRGLWMTEICEGMVDDEIAAKLAIDSGIQGDDLEQEQLELDALKNEQFRGKFLKNNQLWVLQHLSDLLTPEQMRTGDLNGRSTEDYVRSVYNLLTSQGEGIRRDGDRSDISSDESNESGDERRKWSRQPLSRTCRGIANVWLTKARKRLTFSLLVEGITQNNLTSACALCNNPPSSIGDSVERKLTVSLATGGEANAHAIDELIAGFEKNYGLGNMDENLWKSYFRSNAKFITTCNKCMESLRHTKTHDFVTASMHGKERQQTRAVDISSDEDENENNNGRFEVIRITHNSPVGRMMTKWLTSARNKMGGTRLFPKEEAKSYVESYLESLRRSKMRENKHQDGYSTVDDAELPQTGGGSGTTPTTTINNSTVHVRSQKVMLQHSLRSI